MQITIHVNDEQVRRALSQLAKRIQHLRPIMREIGEIVRTSVDRNFAATGRPEKWPGSQRVKRKGGKTSPRVIRPRKAKALFWPGARRPVESVKHPGSRIPARPFLMVQKEDWTEMFQSTPPRGGRPDERHSHLGDGGFQSTPPRGGRL